MATTGFWPVKSRLKEVIDYANNPDKTTDKKYLDEDLYSTLRYVENDKKTDQTMYVSAVNCPKQRAYQCMMTTKHRYGKFGGNIAYHGYQSFKADEVTPYEAHQIGIETAKRMWKDYEVVVTTHLNTDNIHNHLVVNSVSFKTGRKFENHVSDHYKLREISDLICKERGKSVLPPSKFKGNSKKEYWVKKNGGMTHRDVLRKDIDSIIKNSIMWTHFKENLKGFGYEIVRDDDYEHISVKAEGWKRPVRLDSLGGDYTIDAIKRRMERNLETTNYAAIYRIRKSPLLNLERELEFEINYSHDTATILIDTVFYILLQLLKLTRDIDAWGDGGQAHSPLLREALTFERQLKKEYSFLKDNGLRTASDVTAFCREKESEITVLKAERSKIRNSNRRPKTPQERQEKLKAAREITKKLNPLLEQLKIADSALERFPKVWDLLKTEHDIEINALTKTNEKGLKNNEKYKENYSNR
ncbi:MAG: relaxase/mobilization nuclease domain-containing protein [Clostridia bacterium]|nr:relaxase/mobilization nuclease domain-containing protein [Clostridia bacterium]